MSQPHYQLPLLGFAAYSGTGKTTLLEAMLPKLTERGLRVGVIKHAHHNFDIDQEGKDSYRLRKAGASQMLISSRYRNALVTETPNEEATFQQLLGKLDQSQLDLILIEGFKTLSFPKIELHREEVGKPWLHPEDKNIIAIAANISAESTLPQLDINDLETITDFVVSYSKQLNQGSAAASCDILSPAFLSVAQGRQHILDSIHTETNAKFISLITATNKICSEDILSPINVPQQTNSAMDGFAIRSDDLEHTHYHVIADVMAGYSYDHPLEKGQAVRIMTGAPVPVNADTVIMREQAQTSQHGQETYVCFDTSKGAIKAGQNVRLAGEDLKKGQITVAEGTRITAPELGMLASLGFDQLPVYHSLKVAIFSTGDEVQEPGENLKTNCIYDSNRYALHALLTQLGCEVIDLGIIEDNQDSLERTLLNAAEQADLILSSGGVSVGDADYIKNALKRLGNINFWRINMRPGRPLAFGHINKTPFFGLPGNPVAVMVSFLQFVEPAIHKLQGDTNWQPEQLTAIATEFLRSRLGRTEYSRGFYSINANGQIEVKTTGKQGSGILRSMSEANCLIEIYPEQECIEFGGKVNIIPLSSRL